MARTLELDFELYDKQLELVESTIKYTGFVSGIGGGKTTAGAVKSTVSVLSYPGAGMIIAPTYGMLEDSTLRTFKKIAGEAISSYNIQKKLLKMVNGREILCRSADDPDHLRGPNISWIWMDEAQLMSEEAWLIAEGRLREGLRQAWATFTPNGKLHWTYRVFGKNDETHKLIHATTQENIYLPPDYIQALEQSYTGDFARQELGGEFVDPTGTLFKREWFRYIHPENLPLGLQWVRSWDLALSEEEAGDSKKSKKPDRTASVCMAVDSWGNIYIKDGHAWRQEWPQTRREMIDIAKQEKIPLVIETVAFQKAAVQELLREPELLGMEITGYNPSQKQDGQYYDVQGFHPVAKPTNSTAQLSQREAAYADRNPRRDKDKTKVDRARVWQSRAANRQIFFVEGAWSIPDKHGKSTLQDCLDEVCDFRADMTHEHDDWVDAISIGMKHLKMPLMLEPLRGGNQPIPLAFDSAFNKPITIIDGEFIIV